MDRFFLPPSDWTDAPCLSEAESHHCTRVMRKSVGDQIEVFDGRGRSAPAEIISEKRRQVSLALGDLHRTPDPSPELELAVGIPKGKLMDLIIQKAVELGVNRMIPLMTAQGTVQFSEHDAQKKTEKWQRVALEACKQCRQNWLPEIGEPTTVQSYLEQDRDEGMNLVAALTEGAKPLRDYYHSDSNPSKIRFLVGPEGDFSSEEYSLIECSDFQSVSLGDLVLRVETAVFLLLGSARVQYA